MTACGALLFLWSTPGSRSRFFQRYECCSIAMRPNVLPGATTYLMRSRPFVGFPFGLEVSCHLKFSAQSHRSFHKLHIGHRSQQVRKVSVPAFLSRSTHRSLLPPVVGAKPHYTALSSKLEGALHLLTPEGIHASSWNPTTRHLAQ
jgi:hypothetical protein